MCRFFRKDDHTTVDFQNIPLEFVLSIYLVQELDARKTIRHILELCSDEVVVLALVGSYL